MMLSCHHHGAVLHSALLICHANPHPLPVFTNPHLQPPSPPPSVGSGRPVSLQASHPKPALPPRSPPHTTTHTHALSHHLATHLLFCFIWVDHQRAISSIRTTHTRCTHHTQHNVQQRRTERDSNRNITWLNTSEVAAAALSKKGRKTRYRCSWCALEKAPFAHTHQTSCSWECQHQPVQQQRR